MVGAVASLHAEEIGPGGGALVVVLVLIVAVIVLSVAMSGSLKRLRRSVAQGTFGGSDGTPGSHASTAADPDAGAPSAAPRRDGRSSPDPGGPGGAAA